MNKKDSKHKIREPTSCDQCEYQFQHDDDVEEHTNSIHLFPCNQCNYVANYKNDFERHIELNHFKNHTSNNINDEKIKCKNDNTTARKRTAKELRPAMRERVLYKLFQKINGNLGE